jgi:AcrR family transcriptional regulator
MIRPNAPTHARSTRDAILDAAGVLLERCGYHRTTMDGIARRTLYLHFRCKDDVLLARIDRVVERLLAEERALAAAPGDPVETLRRLLVLRVTYRLDTVADYRGSLDETFAALRTPYLERRASWFAAETEVVSRVLEQGRERGLLAFDDARATAHALVVATSSLTPYSLAPRELGARRDVELTLERMADLLIAGLRSRAGS